MEKQEKKPKKPEQEAKKELPKAQPKKKSQSNREVAVVRIRGNIGLKGPISDTMEMLGLFRKNYCIIIKNTPSLIGMIKKCKDYLTWGEADSSLKDELVKKRGEKHPKDPKKLKPFFRLNPPRKGYGRKGIKIPFVKGGALGYRGEKINDLIKRML